MAKKEELESTDSVKDPNQKELELEFNKEEVAYWNCRVLELRPKEGESFFGVFEAEYNYDGDILGYSEEPLELVGESKEDLENIIKLINESLTKDIIVIKEEDDTRGED